MTNIDDTYMNLIRQLGSFWSTDDIDEEQLKDDIAQAVKNTTNSYDRSNRVYYLKNGFDVMNTTVYAVFLYYLAHRIGIRGGQKLADQLYYLNKIMNGVEWYWNIEMPEHFIVEHPIGTVLGKASYGDYFCVYQGVTVGANFDENICIWPIIGNNVTMYAHSSIIGNCSIGNNVIIGANAFIFDEIISDNSIVIGSSPNLRILSRTEQEIKRMQVRIWNFE